MICWIQPTFQINRKDEQANDIVVNIWLKNIHGCVKLLGIRRMSNTPAILVDCIIPHLHQKQFKTIWCPFDTKNSRFHYSIEKKKDLPYCIATFGMGKTSFIILKEDYDAIVSNPPSH